MKTMIRINIDLVRSQVDRQSIFAFDPNSAGAKDYQSLVDELVGEEDGEWRLKPVSPSAGLPTWGGY